MEQELKKFRSTSDSALQRDIKRTNLPKKSSLDYLDLATRHEIFFRKVEDQKSLKSLPGDNSQCHWDITQQNKVAKEQKGYQENSGTADKSLPQSRIEHVPQAETSRREGLVSILESTEMPKGEPSGSSWDTVKSLSEKSLTQLARGTVEWAWQTLSEKSLAQHAREAAEWTWQNGVKALSWKNLKRAMVMYLAVSGPYRVSTPYIPHVKIYGKNGCSIDSHLVINEHPPAYNNARRIVEAEFERTFAKLVERYKKDPCDNNYEKIHVAFNSALEVEGERVLGFIDIDEPTHVFLQPIEARHTKSGRTLGSTALHEFSHVVQELHEDNLESEHMLYEAYAEYNIFIYGTKQDTQRWPVPPNLKYAHHYTRPRVSGGFMLWLDKEFPGFVDDINKIAKEKQITNEDIKKFTGGQSLESLWRKYKKIDFTAEMSQFIEEQRQKYLGSDQQRKGKER